MTLPLELFDPGQGDTVALCPNCGGRSPTAEAMAAQVAATGDVSGACGTCGNAHYVTPDRAESYLKACALPVASALREVA